jgi:hypothetical protein
LILPSVLFVSSSFFLLSLLFLLCRFTPWFIFLSCLFLLHSVSHFSSSIF